MLFHFFDYGYANNSVFLANLSGEVLQYTSSLPVPNAHVHIEPLNLNTTTNENGLFLLQGIQIPEAALPITVTVTAEGYAPWKLINVPLVANDTLVITSKLGDTSYIDSVPLEPNLGSTQSDLLQKNSLNQNYTIYPISIPKYIRVRVSGSPYNCDTDREYHIEVIEFKDYVKHVLPNEWNNQWHMESLRSGAMAVKMYAWYWIALGGKWKDADVWDSTCDQVYNPNYEYESTNSAVDYIWNWVLLRNNMLVHTSYRSTYEQCIAANLEGKCMGQVDSQDMAVAGFTWDEILMHFYNETQLLPNASSPQSGFALRFNGSEGDYKENRVLIPIATNPPVNVGSQDFTIEWWMKILPGENIAPAVNCGMNDQWIYGNIIFDQRRSDGSRGFGVSLSDGRIILGIFGENKSTYSLCGKKDLRDGIWHHVAVQRRYSDGALWIYVDGKQEAFAQGPIGNISYEDDQSASNETDPYISIGAWKLDENHNIHPFFRGWIDEIRFSNAIRYLNEFAPPTQAFHSDGDTVALYHLDEGVGNLITDTSGAMGGPSHGIREYGGVINGPEWVISDLFHSIYIPLIAK